MYDVNGRFIAELTNKNLSAGDHNLVWNANNAASGIYVARIVIGNTVLNKKLIKN